MERYFQINNEDQKPILNAINKIKDLPRVGARFNQNNDGWQLTIDGNENDVQLLIDKLEELGFTL